ncbi:GntR family transcriptional regulator [Roseinatronobacter monicus]|uniref:DNA-binding GntR family transcriptional regulator n=1 Tax=Roseinatronobacter monicus TaxID=393481 RepID=A0A543KHN3_9RHOB|nr:GntR family transcriptional regulator [Roseinatronobacter monicus]TQM94574.1 DNA-binding GntR family transcriptional regulator [Roseinatronobacter monicus]
MLGTGPSNGSAGSEGGQPTAAGADTPTGNATLSGFDLGEDETRQGRIHRKLRDLILTGGIAPGTRLRETELSARFGSSRAPLREAMRRLESEGLVRSDFWRGSRVAEYTATELYELYALRGLIEGYAAALLPAPLEGATLERMATHLDAMSAAARANDWLAVAQQDTGWHREIMLAAHRPLLLDAWDSANGPLQMTFGQVGGAFYGRDDIHDRHHAVLDALTKPAPQTEATIRQHYLETAERVLATVISGYPTETTPPEGPDAASSQAGQTEQSECNDPNPTGEKP